uniref:CG31058-PA n=1 Tax=Drosophila melanogaster TaxID=7227 RepID=G3LFF3_DROME|nr:CG31058-PA [Drosophila melanogaster]
MYGTGKDRSGQEIISPQDYPVQQQRAQSKSEYVMDSASVDRPQQQSRPQPTQDYVPYESSESSVERKKEQPSAQLNTDYNNSNTTSDSASYGSDSVSKQQIRSQQNPEYQTNPGPVYESPKDDRSQLQPQRSQPAADYSAYEWQQRPPPTTLDYTTGYNAPPKDRTTLSRTNSRPTLSSPNSKLQSIPNTEYVRPPQNFVLPPQMRPAVGPPQPRPPFAGARPMVGMGPRPPMPPNMAARPPPLRSTDSKSNLLMGPPMRPGMPPQLNMQQARLPNAGGQLSPPGQGPPRPPGGFPWNPAGAPGMPPGARPPQNMTRPPPPTFARPPPGQPLQAPFNRPPFNQPPMQPQQQQPPQQLQQQQQQQQQQQHMQQQQQLRPLSAASAHNNNDDDDDVVMGPAVTPLKTFNSRPDPMGEPLLEDIEPPFQTSPPAGESKKGPGFSKTQIDKR